MLIGLIPNPEKDPKLKKTAEIVSIISRHGGKSILDNKYRNFLVENEHQFLFGDVSCADILLCLGGDGTFLTAIRDTYNLKKPIVGFNLGSLGFLAEISQDNLEESIIRILNGEYTTESRMMISAVCEDKNGNIKGESIALNDIVISRGGTSRILDLDLFIDKTLIERFPGDGIIVSTPTGSTAYSLSAGGPIIQPNLHLMIINPINPHTLHNRCYVSGPDSLIQIKNKDYSNKAILTSDGSYVCELDKNDIVSIKCSEHHMNLILLDSENFYKSISSKIYMRGR